MEHHNFTSQGILFLLLFLLDSRCGAPSHWLEFELMIVRLWVLALSPAHCVESLSKTFKPTLFLPTQVKQNVNMLERFSCAEE